LSEENISVVVGAYRNKFVEKDTASLYILFTSSMEGSPKRIGSTHEEYGIVVFGDALKDFSD